MNFTVILPKLSANGSTGYLIWVNGLLVNYVPPT
jgi:hypothetical protein